VRFEPRDGLFVDVEFSYDADPERFRIGRIIEDDDLPRDEWSLHVP
jgi:hypothetical protein